MHTKLLHFIPFFCSDFYPWFSPGLDVSCSSTRNLLLLLLFSLYFSIFNPFAPASTCALSFFHSLSIYLSFYILFFCWAWKIHSQLPKTAAKRWKKHDGVSSLLPLCAACVCAVKFSHIVWSESNQWTINVTNKHTHTFLYAMCVCLFIFAHEMHFYRTHNFPIAIIAQSNRNIETKGKFCNMKYKKCCW